MILLAFRVTDGHLEGLRRVIVLVNLRYLSEFSLTIKDSGKGHFPQCLKMPASGPISVASWENISGGPRFHESSRLSVFNFTENWLPSRMLFMICLNIWKKTIWEHKCVTAAVLSYCWSLKLWFLRYIRSCFNCDFCYIIVNLCLTFSPCSQPVWQPLQAREKSTRLKQSKKLLRLLPLSPSKFLAATSYSESSYCSGFSNELAYYRFMHSFCRW